MGWFHLDYWIHVANVLLLAAYSVRDILWLRIFAVASSLAAIPYFLFQPTPLWAAFGWSVLFTAINMFQCWRIFLERRPVKLTDEEEEVRALVFAGLATGDVLRVLSIGSWATAESGQRLIQRDKPVESISLIVRGRVRVTKDKQVLGELGAGQIVGSALLLSGATAEVDAVAVEPSRTVQWNVGTLERYLNAHPETRNVLQRHLARDLAGKLQTMADGVSNNTTSTGMS
jgi:hypothetical protein